MNIRLENKNDAAVLVAIYAPYVEKTAITFEYDVPSVEEFSGRIEKTLERYPYLVAEGLGSSFMTNWKKFLNSKGLFIF